MNNSQILELASNLAHDKLIEEYRDLYSEDELQSENNPEIYKKEVQDSFDDLYDYFYSMIEKVNNEVS